MSTPVDIPQNINIHIPHVERVIEPQRAQVANNSADQSYLELANRQPEHKSHHIKNEDDENKREYKDHYDRNKEKENDDKADTKKDEKDIGEINLIEAKIGKKIDFTA